MNILIAKDIFIFTLNDMWEEPDEIFWEGVETGDQRGCCSMRESLLHSLIMKSFADALNGLIRGW